MIYLKVVPVRVEAKKKRKSIRKKKRKEKEKRKQFEKEKRKQFEKEKRNNYYTYTNVITIVISRREAGVY